MVDAREYHDRTNHSPERLRDSDFSLDRSNQPRPYKVYEDLPRVDLPGSADPSDEPVLSAIATSTARPDPGDDDSSTVDGRTLATLCHYASGVTKTLEVAGRERDFRAAACTGKLYHVDLYAVTGQLEHLDPGVYHFDPDAGRFDVLREGDVRGILARASGGHEGVATAPVTFVATSQWWRNAWKYRERTYRHAFWDSGTILANLLAVAHAAGHRAGVVTGFVDDAVCELLGLDHEREAPLELVPVGSGDRAPDSTDVPDIDPDEVPLSESPVDYPLVWEAWEESRLADADAVRSWREAGSTLEASDLGRQTLGDGEWIDLDPVDRETASARPVGNAIERRGSLREYSHEPISDRLFATVLDRALQGVPLDWGAWDGEANARRRSAPGSDLSPIDCYCLVHAVEGIPSGAYQYFPGRGGLERVGATDRKTAGHLALDQPVVGDAAANVYLLADVDAVVESLGDRGYRLAQLVAGISLGRLYLATYAHRRIGGRGFTFYDDLVSDHLSPRAADQAPMTMFAFGRPAE